MIEHNRRSTDRLESRLEFETLISDLSSRFINLPSGDVDREIEGALRRICEFLRLELAVLWQWSLTEPAIIAPTHSYLALDGPRPSAPMSQEDYPWSRRQMLEGRAFAISSPEDLPAEAAVDRETCYRYGIKSAICLPLSIGGGPSVGALGLNSLCAARDWPDALVKRLELVAQILTNALARRRYELSIQESQERLELAADSAEAGLWTFDFADEVFWATDRARAIFGYSADEVIDLARLATTVHAEDLPRVREFIETSREDRSPRDLEYRIVRDGGEVRWISSRARPKFTSSGALDRLMGLSIDITDRRRAEDASHGIEARLAAAAHLAELAFYEVNFGDGVAYVDDRFRELCGVPDERMKGLQPLQFWLEQLHPDDRERVVESRARLHRGEVDPLVLDYRFLNPVAGQKWLHHVGRVMRRDADGRPLLTFGVLRDITESKRAEETLRDLSRRLIRAQEEERAMLARELHDDVTQRLAVLAIDAGRAELAMSDGPLAGLMRSIRDGLARLSEDIHTLAYQLHPSVLEELGLGEALRTECERLGRRSGVSLSLDLDPVPAAVGRDAALCLFRVAQEALNNMSRHAAPSSASLSLRQMDGGLLLAVRDDGVGFEIDNPKKARSLGLASMRERVRLVNGTLDIESSPGHGTAVVAWVPAEGDSK
jgi:PAS domain S-box-containing protein